MARDASLKVTSKHTSTVFHQGERIGSIQYCARRCCCQAAHFPSDSPSDRRRNRLDRGLMTVTKSAALLARMPIRDVADARGGPDDCGDVGFHIVDDGPIKLGWNNTKQGVRKVWWGCLG